MLLIYGHFIDCSLVPAAAAGRVLISTSKNILISSIVRCIVFIKQWIVSDWKKGTISYIVLVHFFAPNHKFLALQKRKFQEVGYLAIVVEQRTAYII